VLGLWDEYKVADGAAVLASLFARALAYCWRANLRNPQHTTALVLLIAIGFAPSITMFTVLDRALFRPADLPHLDRVVFIRGAAAPPGDDQLTWWSQARTLGALASYSAGGANSSVSGQSERIRAAVVSASFFRVAEVLPSFGRTLLPDEQGPGFESEAVVSNGFAVTHFGTAPSAIGQPVTINAVDYRVIGVMPPGFGFPGRTDIWVPRPMRRASAPAASETDLDIASLSQALIGRLTKGATLGEARAELIVMSRRLEDTYRKSGVGFGLGATAIPLKEALSKESRPALLALSGAVLLVLLLTCANVASLLLARAVVRKKELAIRASLGATRSRLCLELLAESILFAAEGGALGIFLAVLGIDLFRAYAPSNVLGMPEIGIEIRTVALTFVIALFTGVVFGLAPALQSFASDIAQTLKEHREASVGPNRLHVRRALVVVEVVLALVLTTGAVLMVNSLRGLTRVEPGFDPRNALTAELALPRARYVPSSQEDDHGTSGPRLRSPAAVPLFQSNSPTDSLMAHMSSDGADARLRVFQQSLFERIGRLPGVVAVGAVSDLPLVDNGGGFLAFDVRGTPQLEMAATFNAAGEYFRAMSIPLRSGRPFADSDGEASSRVAIINETLARRCWPGKNPVGDTLVLEGEPVARQVVGVVGDVKYEGLGEVPGQQIYLPWFQPFSPQKTRAPDLKMALVVRAASGTETLAPLIRNAVASLDNGVPLFSVQPLEEIVSHSAGPLRLRAVVLSFFAVLALGLAAAGVYGVVSYSVARRTHEIGVRMSLGARRRDILLLVIRDGARLGLVGVLLGTLASLEVGRLISSLLFGVLPDDPATLAAASLSLFMLTLIASAVPAFRAASLDPATSIRHE
jgi:putative ABC transport system permease protein